MPRLTGIVFTDRGATWSMLPDSTAQIRVMATTSANRQTFAATARYFAGQTELAVDLDIPGFDAAWRLNGTPANMFMAYDDQFSTTAVFEGTAMLARKALAEAAASCRIDQGTRVREACEAATRARALAAVLDGE